MNNTILIIEDDKAIIRFLNVALKTNGYQSIVEEKGLDGISAFLSHHPDLVLLDLGLPDIDGMEVLKQIREISNVPVIVVSARDKEKEKVQALDEGADDYVTKPFNIGELLARIRVSLRKAAPIETAKNFVLRGLEVDFDKRIVRVNGNEVHLTPIEYKILSLLIENKGKVLTHSFIQNKIWGYDTNDDFQSLRVFMASIRRKIESDTTNPIYLLTEVGVGYRLIDD